jgi:hypothetical protein
MIVNPEQFGTAILRSECYESSKRKAITLRASPVCFGEVPRFRARPLESGIPMTLKYSGRLGSTALSRTANQFRAPSSARLTASLPIVVIILIPFIQKAADPRYQTLAVVVEISQTAMPIKRFAPRVVDN